MDRMPGFGPVDRGSNPRVPIKTLFSFIRPHFPINNSINVDVDTSLYVYIQNIYKLCRHINILNNKFTSYFRKGDLLGKPRFSYDYDIHRN